MAAAAILAEREAAPSSVFPVTLRRFSRNNPGVRAEREAVLSSSLWLALRGADSAMRGQENFSPRDFFCLAG
jgi:hypothetical protein